MKKVLSLVLTLALLAFPKIARADSPCQTTQLQTAAVNISTLTTTEVIVGGSALTLYVCALFGTFSETTTGTMTLEYGQGATCGTNTVAVSGPMPIPSTTTPMSFIAPGVLYRVPINASTNNFCIVTAGTTVSVVGSITYTFQP